MQYASTLATLASVFALGLISPGPNFVIVTSTAVRVSRRAGCAAALGLAAASLTWTVLAIAGVGYLISRVEWLNASITIAGSVYLIYIGFKALKAFYVNSPVNYGLGTSKPDSKSAFITAYVISMTNPKSAAFFVSIFAVVFPQNPPVLLYFLTVVIAVSLSLIWHGFLAIAFSTKAVRNRYLHMSRWIDLLTGTLLIAIGGNVLLRSQ